MLLAGCSFELSCAAEFGETDNAPRISDNLVRRARNRWVRGLWGDARVMALLGLQFGLLDNQHIIHSAQINVQR